MVHDESASMRLVRTGFIAAPFKHMYKKDKKTNKFIISDPEQFGQASGAHADEEKTEEANLSGIGKIDLIKTGYPKPAKRYKIIVENFNLSLEETYYWFLNHLRQDMAFPRVDKITDIFSASETSAFFGQSAQRLSIQEDRASGFMRGIAELVKQLFQIIRELRILDERLESYEAWIIKQKDGTMKKSKSADVTLKGLFADFAENKGGQMQPGSMYHLSQQVGYASLPDLFFNTHIYKSEDVDKVIDGMKSFNPNVRNVLKRKLFQFLIWKEKTHTELLHRRKFQIRYLRQHWATIKMYMSWTKPYLRHIKRLHMNEKQLESPDLITAFETSMSEVEILCIKPKMGGYHPCVLATFQFNTKPIMQYRQEYQQGPVHVGRATVTLRTYAWTEDEIAKYKKLRSDEEKDLLYLVDESVQMAMEELGEELDKYLNEEYERIFDEEIREKYGKSEPMHVSPRGLKKKNFRPLRAPSALEPFGALFGGVLEIGSAFISLPKRKPKVKGGGGSRKAAEGAAAFAMWQAYKNYKKSHGLIAW